MKAEKTLASLFHCTGPTNLHKQSLGKVGVQCGMLSCCFMPCVHVEAAGEIIGVV